MAAGPAAAAASPKASNEIPFTPPPPAKRPADAKAWEHWVGGDFGGDLRDRYDLGEQLGRPGAYGYALLATRHRDKRKVAIKVVDKAALSAEDRMSLSSEVAVMRRVAHRHLVQWMETVEDEQKVYIVMEPLFGGELLDRLTAVGTFGEQLTLVYTYQMLSAVASMHGEGVAHCDLKPDNILMATEDPDSEIKVIDFGLAKFCVPFVPFNEVTGTPYYIAPEVLKGEC